jgi:hypothetical protein
MSRAYLRLDPAIFERKALDQGYPLPAVAAFVGVLCQAEHQPQRGKFRDERLLRALLGPAGRWVGYLIDHGDLVRLADGRLYVDGWDEWQEGDWRVAERVTRIRDRRKANGTAATVTNATVKTVSTPSEAVSIAVGGEQTGIQSVPQPLGARELEAS